MASGARSTHTVRPTEKITLAECQALIESKSAELARPILVTVRFAFGVAMVALALALIALTMAVVR